MIVGYVFFAIMTSGLCLASSLGTVFGIERFRPLEKRHAILAVLSLTTAFGIIALDLHYPVRMVFGAVLVPSPTSPMWWMGVFYGAYLVVLLVEVWSMFTDHPKIHQWACTLAACIAILAPATLGAVFGVLAAKPFWIGPFTAIHDGRIGVPRRDRPPGHRVLRVHRLAPPGPRAGRAIAIPSIRLLLTVGLVVVSLARRSGRSSPGSRDRARAARGAPRPSSRPARPGSSGSCGWSPGWSCRWPCCS